jgi:hypothetical protein
MKMTMVIQGREITHDDIESVRRLVKANPSWKRTRLSKELCVLWNWRRQWPDEGYGLPLFSFEVRAGRLYHLTPIPKIS